jgi:dTDP-4-dehydrorhamnose reductase/UDP-glucose 4-epimerase
MGELLGIVGGTSFTARALVACGEDQFKVFDPRSLPNQAELQSLSCVVNCAFDPRLNGEPYDPESDLDLKWAEAAAQNGTHFVMLSSRKVYAVEDQFGATESSRVTGLDAYGRNKAETERRIQDLLPPEQLAILRMGNLIGMEYPRNRLSLMGYMLSDLAQNGAIHFTQSPFSRRDCVPFEVAAKVILQVMNRRLSGTYNLGAGFATMIGELALWVIQGYGSGSLCTSVGGAQGEFCLQVDKLKSAIPFEFSRDDLRAYCVGLGQSLAALKTP